MAQLRQLRTARQPIQFFTGLTRTLLAAAIFITPLMVLPGLNDVQELPKASVFMILTLAAAVAWTLSWLTSGELHWRRLPGWQWLAVFVLGAAFSMVLSVSRSVSWIGFAGYMHDTMPFVLTGIVFWILLVQVFDHHRDLRALMVIVTTALGLTAVQALLQVAGASPLPWPSLQAEQLLVAGNSSFAMSLLMAVLVILATTLYRHAGNVTWKILTAAAAVLGLMALLSIDATAGWVALIVGLVVSLVAASVRPLARIQVAAGVVAMTVAIIGLLIATSGWLRHPIVHDAQLDQKTSWTVTTETLRTKLPFGSGPATFYYDMLAHRPAAFNVSPLAGLSFIRASDAVLTMLPTFGLVATAGFVGFAVWLLWLMVRSLERLAKTHRDDWEVIAATLGVGAALTVGLFFAPGTVTLMAVVWLSMGLIALILTDGQPATVRSAPVLRAIGTMTFLVAVVSLVFVTVWSTKLILADRELINISAAVGRTEDLNKVVARIDRAIRLVPQNPLPYFLRAQAEMIQAQLLLNDNKNDEAMAVITRLLQDANAGIARDPKNAVLYTTLGTIYKAVGTYVGGAGEQVIQAYTKAAELDPNNARVHIDLGQTHYLVALAVKDTDGSKPEDVASRMEAARKEFERAWSLHPGNPDAGFGLILVDEYVGNTDQAFNRLTELVAGNPSSAALWYELAVRQVAKDQVDNARRSLERTLSLQPTFAPAHVQLGILAEKNSDLATARVEYQRALELDASNEDAQKRLDALPKT
ncbi:MAG: hypothetical protein HY976_01055 [Candidatus Kerfeldbacteria bacterium]|nr:hypothetical protein [Candidatus Kerfeldbacteria bacterium]